MRTLFATCATVIVLVTTMWGQTAQNGAVALSDTDIQLLRSDLRAERETRSLLTQCNSLRQNLRHFGRCTRTMHDQQRIGDDLVKLVKDFSNYYDNMDDTNATDMVQRMLNIEERGLNLRKKYWPKFEKAPGGKEQRSSITLRMSSD